MRYLLCLRSLGLWVAGISFFLFSFGVLAVCLMVLPRERTFLAARFLFSILLKLMGIGLEVRGKDNIDPSRSYLIMGNHQSLFDLFVIPSAIPLCFTGIEAAYHFSLPVWGYLIRKWGCIPIEREDLEKAKKSLELARVALDDGMSIAVLPEGHRTRTGLMGPFKKGPFHLAKACRATILPFGIQGLYDFQAKGSFNLRPGRVIVTIGKPVPYRAYSHMSVEEVRELLFSIIQDLSCEESAIKKQE